MRRMRVACLVLVLAATATALEWVPAVMTQWEPGYAIDEMNDRLVVFAGRGEGTELSDETWEMSLDTLAGYRWRRLDPTGTPPSARFEPAMVYDPQGERMVVFGGERGGSMLGDVWELSLEVGNETWRQLFPEGTAPAPRRGCFACYHPARHSVIMFGGVDGASRFDDSWELCLDSLRWRELEPTGTPPAARSHGVSAWDSVDNRILIVGGRGPEQFYNDVHALSLEPGSEGWTALSPGGQVPAARAGSGGAYDACDRSLFLFGGYYYAGGFVFYNDLYQLDLVTLSWQHLSPTGTLPRARRHPVFVCDAENRRLVLQGGDVYYERFADWWHMDIAMLTGVRQWTDTPPPRAGFGLQVLSVAGDQVRVRCVIPHEGQISLRVLDTAGRVVRTLHSGAVTGDRVVAWDRKGDDGRRVASGAYFLYLQAGEVGASRKVALTN
ncbi:MAG: kelch repeat-containing protein [bacterium]